MDAAAAAFVAWSASLMFLTSPMSSSRNLRISGSVSGAVGAAVCRGGCDDDCAGGCADSSSAFCEELVGVLAPQNQPIANYVGKIEGQLGVGKVELVGVVYGCSTKDVFVVKVGGVRMNMGKYLGSA